MFDIPCRPLQKQQLVRRVSRQKGSKGGRTGRVKGIVVGVVELEVERLIENQIDVVELFEDLEPSTESALVTKNDDGDISRVLNSLEFAEWSIFGKVCMYCTVNVK